MLKNGQTYSKNLAVLTAKFLKYVWSFFKIIHEKVNSIQVGGQKEPPDRFSLVTSRNVVISSQNIMTFSFNA